METKAISIANLSNALLAKSKTRAIVIISGDVLTVLRSFLAEFDSVVDLEADEWQDCPAFLSLYRKLLAELAKPQFKIIQCTCPPEHGLI